MTGQIYHVGAVCVQKCSILILHNQLVVRHDQRNTLCFQSENLLKKQNKKNKTKKNTHTHNCDAGYDTGRRNVITLFMMSLYKDGCPYGERILHGSLLHGSYAWKFLHG